MAGTVARRRWNVDRAGRNYLVEMEDEYFFGKRVVRVDGNVAYEGRSILQDHSGIYEFDVGGAPSYLRIRTKNGVTYSYDLIADGSSPEQAGPPIKSEDLVQQLPTPLGTVWTVAWMTGFLAGALWLGDGRLWREPIAALAGTAIEADVASTTVDSRGGHSAQYRFSVDGRTFTSGALISLEQYERAGATGHLAVRYVAIAPDINAPETDVGSLAFDVGLVALLAVGIVSYGRSVVNDLKLYRTVRRLRTFGSEAVGRITGSSSVRNQYMVVVGCVLRYVYRGPDLTEYAGQSGRFGLDALRQWPVGASVRIRFDSQHPEHSLFVGT